MLDRDTARAIAKDRFSRLNAALMLFWQGKGPEPIEAEYGYRHGWVKVGPFNFRSDEISDGVDQPVMD